MTDTGHLLTVEHTGTTASVRATAAALGVAADYLAQCERAGAAGASLLRQTAAAVSAGGGTVDLIAASLEDLADVALMLVLPDSDLFGQYLAIAAQYDVAGTQLLATLAALGLSYNEVFGLVVAVEDGGGQ